MTQGGFDGCHELIGHANLVRQRSQHVLRLLERGERADAEPLVVGLQLFQHVQPGALPGLLFEDLGFSYLGPVNGHDVAAVLRALGEAKERMEEGPVLLHVQTKKGFGYDPAVKDPLKWHGVTAFDAETGEIRKIVVDPAIPQPPSYTSVFGNTLTELARIDPKIVAVTAAMLDGTGLNIFQKAFPERCFDVGIAEQHAVTFAAGLATQGMRPVAAIYSTFLQRGFDQVLHDVCLQNLPVTFAMDRAGLVGADGPTHHGLYDLAYLRCLPNIILMAPKDENELRRMLMTALYCGHPAALRYPRGNGLGVALEDPIAALPIGKGELLREGEDLLLCALGSMVDPALKLAGTLAGKGLSCAVINARFLKPLDERLVEKIAAKTNKLIVIEENSPVGGLACSVNRALSGKKIDVLHISLPDAFVEHGSPNFHPSREPGRERSPR